MSKYYEWEWLKRIERANTEVAELKAEAQDAELVNRALESSIGRQDKEIKALRAKNKRLTLFGDTITQACDEILTALEDNNDES